MSLLKYVLAALAAAWFLSLAPQAQAKEAPASQVLACTQAWAKAYAREHSTTVEGAMRYARRIKTTPPTTLYINGKAYVFSTKTLGATVWGTCAASLAAESAAQTTQPSVQPAVYDGDQSVQKVIDDLNSEITALEAQVNARRFPWVEYLTVSIASILLTLAGVWMFVKMRIQKILWKRKVGYDQIGPSGQRDPSRVRDDPGYDDPYPPGT